MMQGIGHTCDYPAPLTDFQAARYMGNWFEQQHKLLFEPPNCVQGQYYNLEESGHF